MTELDTDDLDLMLSRMTEEFATAVYFKTPSYNTVIIAIWHRGNAGVNLYNRFGVEIDYFQCNHIPSTPEKARKEILDYLKTHETTGAEN